MQPQHNNKAHTAEIERQSKEFDTQLEKQTEEQIKEIRRNLEGEKDKRLSSLREDTQAALSQLDAYYAKNHERLSREIFEAFFPTAEFPRKYAL